MIGVKKFYITTAIDYVNAKPHIGHAYEKLCADVLARWHRLKGEEVFFLTGTDEHGQKVAKAAKKAGKKPKEFADEISKKFKELCRQWNISNDYFIRTTDENHKKVTTEIFKKVLKKGDIFKGEYEGLYCTGCEAFYLEKDLINGNCPVHETKCESIKEESYFFKMSNYYTQLLEHFEKHPEFIQPEFKYREILNRLKAEGLKDLSVSRAGFDWGIPLPNDSKHVQYVWFDALLNYISGIDYPNAKFKKFWPADIHLIGKDILWFHSVIFPCILLSAGIELPKTIFVHGFVNVSGKKLSKSKGKVIDPTKLAEKFSVDAIRYFLIREIPFGQDGDFSEENLVKRINNELANDLGNLVYRVLSLIEKKCDSKIPNGKVEKELEKELNVKKVDELFEALELNKAVTEIWKFVKICNKFVNDKKVWELKGKELNNALYSLADALRIIAILLEPILPESTAKINEQIGCKKGSLKEAKFGLIKNKVQVKKSRVLFKKII